MKRITLWFLSTLSVVVLLFGYDASSSSTTTTSSPTSIVSGTTGPASSSPGSAAPSASATPSSGSSGGSATSSATTRITGAVASTQWGPVQVELTVSAGKITKVDVLQQPSGNPKDDEINSYALPILTRETTDKQSSNIDMVSGATVTSTGYIQSLQSAIDKANA